MDKIKKPKIRFEGFTDDWEQRKFKDCFDYLQNNALSRSELSDEDGGVLNVHYGDILVKFGEVIDLEKDSLPTIVDESILEKYNSSLLQDGDIVIADAAEDETVGKCSEIKGCNGRKVLSGLHTIPVRTKYIFACGYLGYYMNSSVYHDQLLPLMQGTKVSSISKSAIQETYIVFPKDEIEQKQIGSYFQNLDHLITLHQRKCDKLKKIKKSMLQKMFPQNGSMIPEIRFEGFTDDWEQRKLGEIAPLRGGFAFPSGEYCDSGIPIVRISNVLSNGSVGGEFVYFKEQGNDDLYTLEVRDVLLAMSGATTGKVASINSEKPCKYYQNQRVGMFTKNKETDYLFVATIVGSERFTEQLNNVLVAGAQPNVSAKDIDSFEFYIPKSKAEQQQIGTFFKQIDHLITLHQRKLDKLKKIKKACLEKMFV